MANENGLKALVADSDAARAASLTEVLQNCGYTAEVAEDTMSAVMLIDSEPFNVVLCQEVVGGASGLELLQQLHTAHPEIPIIFMASGPDSDAIAQATAMGAADVFATPGDYKALYPKLATLQAGGAPKAEPPKAAPASAGGTPAGSSRMAVHPVQLPELQPGAHKDEPSNVDMILDVPVAVNAVLGNTTMKIVDLLQLGPGSVVELDKRAGEPVDLYVNDKLVAYGEVVVVNETFGVRITEVIDPKQRVSVLQ
jgi:flagellar motor switch protein FliN